MKKYLDSSAKENHLLRPKCFKNFHSKTRNKCPFAKKHQPHRRLHRNHHRFKENFETLKFATVSQSSKLREQEAIMQYAGQKLFFFEQCRCYFKIQKHISRSFATEKQTCSLSATFKHERAKGVSQERARSREKKGEGRTDRAGCFRSFSTELAKKNKIKVSSDNGARKSSHCRKLPSFVL